MKTLVVHHLAEDEIGDAAAFYNGRRNGLGSEFLDEVQRALDRIQYDPNIGSPYKETDFRFYLVRRFPYVVYYLELETIIWVSAVAHGSRRLGYWRKRRIDS